MTELIRLQRTGEKRTLGIWSTSMILNRPLRRKPESVASLPAVLTNENCLGTSAALFREIKEIREREQRQEETTKKSSKKPYLEQIFHPEQISSENQRPLLQGPTFRLLPLDLICPNCTIA